MTAPPAGALEACPFCGHVPQDLRDAFHPSGIRWREDHGQRHYIGAKDPRDGTPCWEMNCLEHEGGCGASMSGDSQEEVLAKWNRRTHGPALLAALRLREWRPALTMPGDGGTYLVTNQLGEVCPLLGGVIQNNVGQQDWTWGNPIIAWMPLPDPPTADDLARVLKESATGDEAASR